MRKKKLVTPVEEAIAEAVADSQIAMMKEETTKPKFKACTPEILADVLAGKYGNGFVRAIKLKKEGIDPESVKEAVAEIKEFSKQLKALKKKFGANWEVVLKVILP